MEEFDTYVLQGNYGGVTGFEDLTADDSVEGIKDLFNDYRENDPNTPLRIVKEFKSGKRVILRKLPWK